MPKRNPGILSLEQFRSLVKSTIGDYNSHSNLLLAIDRSPPAAKLAFLKKIKNYDRADNLCSEAYEFLNHKFLPQMKKGKNFATK